jgi:hypothetical protein
VDLTGLLLRAGAGRPHTLVVPVVGATATRLALEAELARRAWPLAASVGDADLLIVAGPAGPALASIVDDLWPQVPAPRVRVDLDRSAAVAPVLDDARVRLTDLHHKGAEAAGSTAGHGGGMDPPGGLVMADVGEDRDGLTLDRLHIPLGPVLPDWPTGLVLRTTVQGDVIQEAEVDVVDAASGSPFWGAPERALARELDALARLLGVAGWARPSARARRLRDRALGERSGDTHHAGGVLDLVRQVRRSRTLRWSLRGLRAGSIDLLAGLERRVSAVEAALSDPGAQPAPRPAVVDLPDLVVGAEVAAARLVVAALDPDTDLEVGGDAHDEEARHG